MGITINDVKHVAILSRLGLNDEELQKYEEELNDVLNFMEKLNELDTQGVEPTSHVLDIHNVFRTDIIEKSLDLEDVLANAPDREDDYFKVPSIL
ncbi:MAG: aspartyl-tRNA(Asn)/glutamyl-tRNA (Gln) amidotransferase subunit C [Fusobacteria bacterium]|nr:MAG: aspartyl-tRNA(Asn)/glutamyl-tRNA (Gln) amidotransferase subunit C [Fusobacteriota bacterium]KAF0227882.1 MAG: aspartyl-tRNA(Asn)/glutamyl-tRNA (Gln) amidotransferase subunit [Fusobacteriota bacterium]